MARGDLARQVQGQVLDPNESAQSPESLAIGLTRAEVDQQIATARRFPRQISAVQKRILDLATLDDETAQEMIYAKPQGGDLVRGPSIRFAELLLQSWGNARCASRTVHEAEKFVEAEGIYHDLETNVATVQRVRRPILKKDGKRFKDDLIMTVANAAGSIARRNAILGGIPKPIWRNAMGKVEEILKGDVKTLVQRRKAMMVYLKAQGIEERRILETLNVGGIDDVGLDQLLTLHGLASALRNGEGTIEELFPGKQTAAESLAERVAAKPAAAEQEKPAAQAQTSGFSREHFDRETGEVDEQQQEGAGQAETVADHLKNLADAREQEQPAEHVQETGEAAEAVEPEGEQGREEPTSTSGASTDTSPTESQSETVSTEQPTSHTEEPAAAAEEEEEDDFPGDKPTPVKTELDRYIDALPTFDRWTDGSVGIKHALVALKKTEDWKGTADFDPNQARVHLATYEAVQRLNGSGRENLHPGHDIGFFSVWLDHMVATAPRPAGADEIEAVFANLSKGDTYSKLKEKQVADLNARISHAVNAIRGA